MKKLKRLLTSRKAVTIILTILIFLILETSFGALRNSLSWNTAANTPALITGITTSPLLAVFVFLFCFVLSFCVCRLFYKKVASDWRKYDVNDTGVYGSSDFMSEKEKRELFNLTKIKPGENIDPKGIILAKDHATDELISRPWKAKSYVNSFNNENIALVGSSGRGKTSSFLIPTIYELMRMGYSIICTDPKSELYRETYPVAEAAGYKVNVINLLPGQFDCSDGIDLIKLIRTSLDPQTAADVMAKQLVQNFQGDAAQNSDTFWTQANLNCLKLALLYVALAEGFDKTPQTEANAAGSHRTMMAVYELLTAKDMKERIDAEITAHPGEGKFLSGPLEIWSSHSQASSIKAGLGTALGLLQNESVCRILSEDDIDFENFNDEPTILYIVCSDKDTTFRGILTTITTVLFDEITKVADSHASLSLDTPLYFIFEELFSIGKIPDMTEKVSTLRSRKIGMIFCLQDIVQLKVRYEELYESILTNCDIKLFLGGDGEYTTQFFSDLSGSSTVVNEEARRAHNENDIFGVRNELGSSVASQQVQRAVLLTDEISKIKKNELLIYANGRDVLKEHKYFYKNHYYYGYRMVDKSGEIVTQLPTMRVPKWREKKERQAFRINTGRDMPKREPLYKAAYFPELIEKEEVEIPDPPMAKLFSKFFTEVEEEKEPIIETQNTFAKFLGREEPEVNDNSEFQVLDEDAAGSPLSNEIYSESIMAGVPIDENTSPNRVFGNDWDN